MKTFKKSLSLIMAVLMVLSCWVWVAPTEAEAAGAEDGQYYFKWVIGTLACDNSGKWEGNTLQINYIKADGTDGSTTINLDKSKYNSNGNNKVVWEGWIDGFPTWAGWYMKMEWKAAASVWLDADNCYYAVGTSSSNVQAVSNTDSFKWQNDAVGQGTKEGTLGLSTDGEKYPKITTFTGKPAADVTVKVPDISATLEKKSVFSSNFSIKCYDQYGVRITDPNELSGLDYGIKTMNQESTPFDEKFNEETYALWYEGNNVWYNRDVQVKLPKTDLKSYYLFVHFTSKRYGDKNELLSTITLDYPEYTIKVEPNGSIKDLGASMDMSDLTAMTTIWEQTGVYGTTPSPFPNGTASKEGYTFKGFWTTPQPTSGAADYNAYEADFANPVDTATFETYKALNGSVLSEEGLVVTTADGKKYYNAGKQWDKSVDKEIKGPATFYGWWMSSDVVVKFYDVDGSFLGTKITKYNVTEPESWYPNPKDGYNTGAYEYQGFKKQWMDISGLVIAEGSYKFGTDNVLSLTLTPVYEKAEYKNEFYVTFINPNDGKIYNGGTTAQDNNDIGSDYYNYRHILSGKNIPTVNMPGVLSNDLGYSYVFDGWTSQKPASGNYHKISKDDTSIVADSDLVVREDITYYAIYRSTIKEYLVSYSYTDATGEYVTVVKTVPYGSIISTPAEVNRTYAEEGYGYDLTGWEYYDPDWDTLTLGVDDDLLLNDTNFAIANNNIAPAGRPIQLVATYGEGKPTPYTITFRYKDSNGVSKIAGTQVYHGSKISADTVTDLSYQVPAKYDDGTAEYKFANMWIVKEGTADKAEYTYEELKSFEPTSHVTFEAAYGEGTPFYTVKYVYEGRSYSERILKGSNVPAWMIKVGTDEETGEDIYEELIPSKADTETGEYIFEGWFDAPQADESYTQTNGTEYTTASEVTGDLVLYPQFKFSPFKFEIKFVNHKGVQLAIAYVEAGQSFEAVFVEAQKAAQLRDADDDYEYNFIGWDLPLPDNYICEGKAVTYTALYQPRYRYYNVYWHNSTVVRDDDGNIEKCVLAGDPIATTSHTHDGAIYAPSVNLVMPEAATGKTMVFAGWKYTDANGNEADYVRGMKLEGEVRFYASYEEVNGAVTLTTVVDAEETDISIAYDTAPADKVADPADGYFDEKFHRSFTGWFTTATCTCAEEYLICTHVFNLNEKLTANATVYARFEKEEHTDIDKEIINEATYYAVGDRLVGCYCSDATNQYATIPRLQDTTAPTGTIYLAGQSWSSSGAPAYETDNDPISIFVNGNADVVIAANDSGIGVKVIRAFAFPANTVLTAENYGAAQELAVDVFSDTSRNVNKNANYSVKLKNFKVADLADDGSVQYNADGTVKFKNLVDGESYIIYYYVTDKATTANGAPATGNQLNRKVRTAKFTYDTSRPELVLEGDSNIATATSTVTYCGKADIKNIEEGATLTINGIAVAYDNASYTIDEAGNYLIKITDKAGNSTSKKIIVAAGHDEIKTAQDVSCVADGYEKIICAVCAKELKNETIKSEGHQYSEVTTVAPTCEAEGYDIKTCSVCGDVVKTNETDKTGHTYTKDADGNIVYETVTAPTCSAVGKAIANCTVCGKGTKEIDLAVDTENGHKYGAKKVLKATCDKPGEEYVICKYCYEKVTTKELAALGHVNTGRYTKITTAPSCFAEGVETTYCKACDEEISTASVKKVEHTLQLVKYEDEGKQQYVCKVTGCGYKGEMTDIKKTYTYTVTFVGAADDGSDVVLSVDEGNSIEVGKVADPTKDQDNENTYSFAGWKGTDGRLVKLPFAVTKNETYTAEFKPTKRIYTHIFMAPVNESTTVRAGDAFEEFATIVGGYGDENKKPAGIPTKAATPSTIYEFAGWYKYVGDERVYVTDFKMTSDEVFYPEFSEKAVDYLAIFYADNQYEGSVSTTYKGKVKFTGEEPTKAYDKTYHYEFAGWLDAEGNVLDIDTEFTITEKVTRIYGKFNKIEHVYNILDESPEATWAAKCTTAGQTTMKCSCGAYKVEVIPALGHDFSVDLEDGWKKCSRCDVTLAPETKEYTIKFVDNMGNVIKEVKVEEGKEYTITAPEKASTAQYAYEFINWTNAAGNVIEEEAKLTIKADADATYTANYKASTRVYKVAYINYDFVALQVFEVEYGQSIPAFTGATPEKERDNANHYVHKGWDTSLTGTVSGDMNIFATYDAIAHDYTYGTVVKEATCMRPQATYGVCVCGAETARATIGNTAPHTPDANGVTITKQPDQPKIGDDGEKTFTCVYCGEKKTEVIPGTPVDEVIVVVYNNSGKLAANGTAHVTLYEIVDGEAVLAEGPADTLEDGTVTFYVAKNKKWKVGITGDDIEGGYGGEVKAGLNTFGKAAVEEDEPVDTSCKCSCHKNTFWGTIFRFFQRLIMWLTGNPKCCADPDSRIWG